MMKITGTHMEMASSHTFSNRHEITESTRFRIGPEPGDLDTARAPQTGLVRISEAGQSSLEESRQIEDKNESLVDNDPRLLVIKNMLEFITGREVKVFDSRELNVDTSHLQSENLPAPNGAEERDSPAKPSLPAGFSFDYQRHETYSEAERTAFSARGTVRTADGMEIGFTLHLAMERTYRQESEVSMHLGDQPRKKDPLVLNFAGTAAQLTDTRFQFDLDGDGQMDQISFVSPGSGFLVLDRNKDGKIDNGSELFGPTTGDGYAELAALDDDGNGWIDEGDAAFANLRLWTKDSAGGDLLASLQDANVGALALDHVSTPFDIRTNANQMLGQVRDTGVFLQADGKAGTIQQIDLVV